MFICFGIDTRALRYGASLADRSTLVALPSVVGRLQPTFLRCLRHALHPFLDRTIRRLLLLDACDWVLTSWSESVGADRCMACQCLMRNDER